MSDVFFRNDCPFLLCLAEGQHAHPVCSECNSINFGNMNCDNCKVKRPKYDEQLRKQWPDWLAREPSPPHDNPQP